MLISLNDVTLQVGSRQFFEHTTWQIDAGQHWAITGPTGSGKSILARAISRSVSIVHGQILYFFDGAGQAIGRPYLYPREILTLSVETHRDFISRYAGYHQARWQSLEGDDAPTAAELLTARSIESFSPFQVVPPDLDEEGYRLKRQRWVDLLQIGYLLERKVIHLSHGESRKLLIARLLMQSPKLLILDDPLAGLDQESRAVFTRAIEELIGHGQVNVLLVAARAEELPRSITHVLQVEGGRVTGCGERRTAGNAAQKRSSAPTARPLAEISPAFAEMVEGYARSLETNPVLDQPELVHMRDVSVHYGQVPVLQNITWTVRRGERWALLGKNGAGKTTLLSLILADNPQSYANPISLFGQRRGSGESIWEIKRSIGWVSPELQLYFRQAVSLLEVVCSGFSDSVGYAPSGSYSSAQIELAGRWIEAFGMALPPETLFSSLSAGQQRLALLARALVKNPPLLILDEPCQALDELHRAHFLQLLDRLCALTPLTLIYVTHLKGEIPAAITHQLRLEGGKIIRTT